MTLRKELDVLVVGGGAFGTSLATILARLGRKVNLWVRRPEQAKEINSKHVNSRYLPGIKIPKSLKATTDLASTVKLAPVILIVVPSQSFRKVARMLGAHLEGDQIVVHATKGFEIATFKRMSQILQEETCALKIGVLSGPTLAKELMAGHPAGALIASRYHEVFKQVQALFATSTLRVFSGTDVAGTEMAGAFKNIIALGAGISDGLGYGDNTKALLVIRGLVEMSQLGVAMGGEVMTFGGLAGVGDLMATCASPLSRNHTVGSRLAAGDSLQTILDTMPHVAEGVPTTAAVHRHAAAIGLNLPIVQAVNGILYGGLDVADAVNLLMTLPTGRELASLHSPPG